MRLKKLAAAAALTAAMVAAVPSTSWALSKTSSWGTSSVPLIEQAYGSTAIAYGTWSVANTKGVGGAFGLNYSCTQNFWNHNTKKSPSTGRSLYTDFVVLGDVDDKSSIARGLVQACLDIPLRLDPCSGWGYAGPDTY